MKAGFPTKKILITNSSHGIGKELLNLFQSSTIEATGCTDLEVNWSDNQSIHNAIEKHHPFLVINTFSADPLQQLHTDISKNLATACTKIKARIIHLSDYHVFGAEPKNTYFETDKVAPIGELGQALVDSEQHVIEQIEQHVILRSSWLINARGRNLFSQFAENLKLGKEITASKNYLGAPTWEGDLLRVIVGIAQQIFSGAENWGVFHYCSGDKCSDYEFAQYLAQIFEEEQSISATLNTIGFEEREDLAKRFEPRSAVLSCRRVRNNFGIQTRSWRPALRSQLKEWLSSHNCNITANEKNSPSNENAENKTLSKKSNTVS